VPSQNAIVLKPSMEGESGASGVQMPAGLVHIYIPDADIGTRDTLLDTANADNLANVGGDPSANAEVGGFRMITLLSRYYGAALAPSRITDEFTALFLATTDVADTTARNARFSLGTLQLHVLFNRFVGFMQFNANKGAAFTATMQLTVMPDKDTVYDFVVVGANSGYTKYIDGVASGVGSSGVTDVTGAMGNGVYFGRDNPGISTGSAKYGPLYVWDRALSPEEVENARLVIGRPAAA
jgi:hypothetical protein